MTLRPHPKPSLKLRESLSHAFTATISDIEPSCYTQAQKCPLWRQAMCEEITAMVRTNTWSLVPSHPSMNVVGCRWVFRLKRDSSGNIVRRRARLVAKGNHQLAGIDFTETFSPVIKTSTIRTILSLAISSNWSIRQIDIQNAFLHGSLSETVYMVQPPGFIDEQLPNHVCKLHKSLYGLKQAPRAWFHCLQEFLISYGYLQSKADSSLFIYSRAGVQLIMLVYVDDILVTGNDQQAVSTFLAALSVKFVTRDLGHLNFFLGIEALPISGGGFILSQRQYMIDILARANMSSCKPVSTPLPTTAPPDMPSPDPPDPTLYRQLVGSLQYLTLTRPDLSYAVNKVCQHMHDPQAEHFVMVKRILRYVKATLELGLVISPSTFSIQAFSDADWAGSSEDRRSTGGYAVFLGTNLISWQSKKQRTVARSSTESEYKALANCAAELTWLQSLLSELGITVPSAPVLWCDNLGATYLSANPVFHARTKHIEIDFHFVREKVARQELQIQFISTKDQIADVLTKPLSHARFHFFRDKLRLAQRPTSSCEGSINKNPDTAG